MRKPRISVPTQEDAAKLSDLNATVTVWDVKGPSPSPELDMVVLPGFMSLERLSHLDSIPGTFVQIPTIGYDGVKDASPAGFTFANGAGVHETATSELTLAALLAVSRNIPDFMRAQDAHHWDRVPAKGLADSTVLIIGAGGVGNAIYDRLLPFETHLIRMATRARTDERGPIVSIEELSHYLPLADVVIVVVPLTPATHHLVDGQFLASMKDGAILVNVARGKVADTQALVDHSDRIRVVVDVTDPEPLPENHPLWESAALVLPHVGGATDAMQPRLDALIRRQVEHLIAGEEMENIVFTS